MRQNIIRLCLTAMSVATIAPAVVAQSGPGPLSTALYDKWTPEQLNKPGALANYGNHNASIQRRVAGAAPEVHDGFSHILMFTSGDGTFILGGEIVDGPDGKKVIRGGESHKITPGVIYHIPIKVPHWVVPNAGNTVTYFVASINIEKP